MKLICVIILWMLPASVLLRAAEPIHFELHAVETSPGDGVQEYSETRLDGDVEKVLLNKQVLLDTADIGSADLEPREAGVETPGEHAVLLTLTPHGRARFGEITADLVGKRLGMVIDGRLVASPRIREPILGGKMSLDSLNGRRLTDDEVLELVNRINAAVKPAR